MDGRGNAQNNLVLGQAFVDSLTLNFILVGKVHPILISGKQIAAMTPKRYSRFQNQARILMPYGCGFPRGWQWVP